MAHAASLACRDVRIVQQAASLRSLARVNANCVRVDVVSFNLVYIVGHQRVYLDATRCTAAHLEEDAALPGTLWEEHVCRQKEGAREVLQFREIFRVSWNVPKM